MNPKHLLLPLLLLITTLLALPTQAVVSETDSGIFYSVEGGVVTVEGFNAAGTVKIGRASCRERV